MPRRARRPEWPILQSRQAQLLANHVASDRTSQYYMGLRKIHALCVPFLLDGTCCSLVLRGAGSSMRCHILRGISLLRAKAFLSVQVEGLKPQRDWLCETSGDAHTPGQCDTPWLPFPASRCDTFER